MRSALRLLALIAVWCAPLAAQQAKQKAPLVLSAGPALGRFAADLDGVQLLAAYSLAQYRWFGLQLDAGAFWSPTQSFSVHGYLDNWTIEGLHQGVNLHLGFAGTVTPFPRAWLSPYGLIGVAALQSWGTGEGYYRPGDGSPGHYLPRSSATYGKFEGFTGLGLRFRLGTRPVHLELRRFERMNSYTLGTALHF